MSIQPQNISKDSGETAGNKNLRCKPFTPNELQARNSIVMRAKSLAAIKPLLKDTMTLHATAKKTIMGDDDYQCNVCNLSFKFKSNFTQHNTSKGPSHSQFWIVDTSGTFSKPDLGLFGHLLAWLTGQPPVGDVARYLV